MLAASGWVLGVRSWALGSEAVDKKNPSLRPKTHDLLA
jgi:hypothetical protein